MNKFNGTIKIEKELWQSFKQFCQDKDTSVSAEVAKFMRLCLNKGELTTNEEKLPLAFVSLQDSISLEMKSYCLYLFDDWENKMSAIVQQEIETFLLNVSSFRQLPREHGTDNSTDNHTDGKLEPLKENKKVDFGNSEENSAQSNYEALANKSSQRSSQNVGSQPENQSSNQPNSRDRDITFPRQSKNRMEAASTASIDFHFPTDDPNNSLPSQHDDSAEDSFQIVSDAELIELEGLKVTRQSVGRWRRGQRPMPKKLVGKWQAEEKGWRSIKI